MEGNIHAVPLSRSGRYLSSPRKPDHMVLSIIWRVLNLGWVHSRSPSFILATSTSLCVSLCQWYNFVRKA